MMKHFFTLVCLLLLAVSVQAQFPEVTIRQIQERPLDSLLIADTLTINVNSRWTLQSSPLYRDTVVVTALCVAPAKTLTFTQRGWTMLLIDTTSNWAPWGGMLVRVGSSSDTSQAALDGFLNVERGDIIRMTGRVDEFPAGTMNSTTQFVPIPGVPIQIISSAPIPAHIPKTIPDFYQGLFPVGRIKYSTGEPYEGLLVDLATPLTVDVRVNAPRGTFSMVDGSGNQLTDYDASKFFTLQGTSLDHPGPDSIWMIEYPLPGTIVNGMRGFMTTVAGSEAPRGYRIAPIYYGDVALGTVLPSITQHRRNPVVVPSDSAARINVRAEQQFGGLPIASVELIYSVNNGPLITVPMLAQADTTYAAQIPQQPDNTFVHYFIKATDTQDSSAILASSAFGGAASDTSQGFFFYTVLNRQLTIQDIQTTPYNNGRTPYLGAQVSISGVVTADTAHMNINPLNIAGTNAWFMQSGNQPWSGIWFVPAVADSLTYLRNGDSVTVTGTVAEQFEVTRLQNVSQVVVHSSGNPQPAAVVLPTSTFGPTVGNGNPGAEPYEGMLVRFNNVVVTDLAPVFSDPTEFSVDDGTGPVLVRRDGTHNYSNVAADTLLGRIILKLNDRISTFTGVMHYSFNRYKITPRRNDDFGTVTGVEIERSPERPATFELVQNYPNPFNPSTIIEYNLPVREFVTLKIYNILGQQVRVLVDDVQPEGKYKVRFDAASLPTGVYFYSIQAGQFRQVKRMLLLK